MHTAHCVTVVDWYDCKSFSPSKKGPPAGAQTINYEFFQRKLSQAVTSRVANQVNIDDDDDCKTRTTAHYYATRAKFSSKFYLNWFSHEHSAVMARRRDAARRSAGCILAGWRGRACAPIQLCDVFYLVYPFFNRSWKMSTCQTTDAVIYFCKWPHSVVSIVEFVFTDFSGLAELKPGLCTQWALEMS